MHFHCEIRKLNEFRKVFSMYILHYIYQTIMDILNVRHTYIVYKYINVNTLTNF